MTIGDPFGPPLFDQPATTILPSGLTGYYNPYSGKYTTSREYGERMQRGFLRGQTQQTARGKIVPPGLTESALRRQRREEKELLFEERYGFSYSYWLYLRKHWIDEINDLSSPSHQITPIWISQELLNVNYSGHDEYWIERRLDEKLKDMYAYREGDKTPGAIHFNQRDGLAPIEWWYYH